VADWDGLRIFYGFVGGDTSQWQPNLFRNTTAIYPFVGNPGWNLTTAMADDAIQYMKQLSEIAPDKPFFPHYAVGWAWAFDTPFKWVKQVASHFGGTRQGMCMSWPGHIKDVGGMRTQFHHVIDIVPTILEVTGIPAPDTINGIKQRPMNGVSMV
jgi:arylsulfatase A-like enzyme